jgi:hypothetical protein
MRPLLAAAAMLFGTASIRQLSPPGQAGPTGGKCLTRTEVLPNPVARALQFVDSTSQGKLGLTPFDSASVQLVHDGQLCRKASEALGPIRGTNPPIYADVVLVALGKSGYLVHSMNHFFMAGEFSCTDALLDSHFQHLQYMCG